MPLQQFDERDPILFAATQDSTFNPATIMDLSGNAATARRVDQVLLTNGDTTDKTFTFILYDGSTNAQVMDINVPAGTGHGAIVPIDAIATLFGATYPFVILPNSNAVHGKWSAAPAAGHLLGWVLKGGSF